jgi:N-hydroxyarylamine O-acetyltransferase
LRHLGYQVSLYSAEVARKDGGFGIPFDHLTLGVEVVAGEQAMLADVGFGDSFHYPLPLVSGKPVGQLGEWFRLVRDGPWWIVERRSIGERDFHPLYRFTRTPRRLSDFAPGCRYHQTSPLSSFTRGTICTRALADGRLTLHPDRLVVTRSGVRTETPIADRDEWERILAREFGIVF